jgi:hypothetical protein
VCEEECREHQELVKKLIYAVCDELETRGAEHDQDKLETPEIYEVYEDVFDELDDCEYGSPEYKKIFKRPDVAEAKEMHVTENRHHPEFFKDGVKDMNLVDLVEMVCDWCAANQRSVDPSYLEESLEINCKNLGITGLAKNWLKNTILKIAAENNFEV